MMQAALSPKLFFMTKKDPVYILRRRVISASGKPQASKMEKDRLVVYGVESIFDTVMQDYRQAFLFFRLVMEYAVYFC